MPFKHAWSNMVNLDQMIHNIGSYMLAFILKIMPLFLKTSKL